MGIDMADGEALMAANFAGSERMKTPLRPQLKVVETGVRIDRSRDALLTDFGKKTLEDRYLLAGESYQDMFARVATAFSDDAGHAQRVYDLSLIHI